jgi:hypothetical protein
MDGARTEDGNRGKMDFKMHKKTIDPGVYFAEVSRNREVDGRCGFDVGLLKLCSFWIGISFHFCCGFHGYFISGSCIMRI